MNKIINEAFNIGDRFRGIVNGNIFVVESLIQKGDKIAAKSGGFWEAKSDSVVFICENDGKRCTIGLEAAKRLLLERLNEQ